MQNISKINSLMRARASHVELAKKVDPATHHLTISQKMQIVSRRDRMGRTKPGALRVLAASLVLLVLVIVGGAVRSHALNTMQQKPLVPVGENEEMTVKGRSLSDGLPKDVTLTSDEVRDALYPQLEKIIDAIKSTLEQTPPELSADIIDHGITLTGGGALLRGIDLLVAQQTGLTVHIAQKPLDCVADGAGKKLGGSRAPRLKRLSR